MGGALGGPALSGPGAARNPCPVLLSPGTPPHPGPSSPGAVRVLPVPHCPVPLLAPSPAPTEPSRAIAGFSREPAAPVPLRGQGPPAPHPGRAQGAPSGRCRAGDGEGPAAVPSRAPVRPGSPTCARSTCQVPGVSRLCRRFLPGSGARLKAGASPPLGVSHPPSPHGLAGQPSPRLPLAPGDPPCRGTLLPKGLRRRRVPALTPKPKTTLTPNPKTTQTPNPSLILNLTPKPNTNP